jgi:hypothetical protein
MGWMGSETSNLTFNGELDVTSGKKTNRGPVKYLPDEFVNALTELPLRSKMTIRGLARYAR